MNKIPFSIDKRPEIEAGKYKVVTRGGQPVRIICWDRNSIEYPIVALVKTKCGEETSFTYGKRGNFFIADEGDNDLILVPAEPELTDFERCVKECLEYDTEVVSDGDLLEATKEYSKELLALARMELQPEKDLPRWKKCDDGDAKEFCTEVFDDGAGKPYEIAFRVNGYRIFLSDLEKLPKEE